MQQLQKEVCECQNEMFSSPSSAGSAPSGTFTFFPGSSTTNRHRTVISTKILFHELQRWNLYESSLPKSVRLLAQNYNKSVDSPEILQSLPKILLIFLQKRLEYCLADRPRTQGPLWRYFLRNKEIIDMKLKNVAVAVVALALAAGMTACGGSASSTAASSTSEAVSSSVAASSEAASSEAASSEVETESASSEAASSEAAVSEAASSEAASTTAA